MRLLVAALALAALVAPPDDKLAPWGTNTHPSDVAKSHVEDLSAGRHAKLVEQQLEMSLDGVGRDSQARCDLLVDQTVGEQR